MAILKWFSGLMLSFCKNISYHDDSVFENRFIDRWKKEG
jgi:hypothetical protein